MTKIHHKAVCLASIIGMLSAIAPSVSRADEQSTISKNITETTKEYLSDPARTGSLVGSIIAGSAVANPLAPLLGSVVGFVIGKSSSFSDNDNNASRNSYNNRNLITDAKTQVTKVAGLSGTSPLDTLPENGVIISGTRQAGAHSRSSTNLEQGGNSSAGSENYSIPGMAAAQPALGDDPHDQVVIVESIGQSQNTYPLETIVPIDLDREAYMGGTATDAGAVDVNAETASLAILQRKLADACSDSQTMKPTSSLCYYYAQ